ncbi:MAG: hypothetical protein Kow0059_02910 [Candidatus Sumerlaeia bacterium]
MNGQLRKTLNTNVAAVIIIGIHLALSLALLGRYDLSRDEARYWDVSNKSLRGMIEWCAADNYPPLMFFLMAAWRPLLGESEVGLRAPFALFSALALWVVWRFMLRFRLVDGPGEALVVLVLLAVSPMQIFIATQAKYYSLLELLALCFLYGAARLLVMEHSPSPACEPPGDSNPSDHRSLSPASEPHERARTASETPSFNSSDSKGRRLKSAVLILALVMIYLHYLGFVIIAAVFLAAQWQYGWRVCRRAFTPIRTGGLILLFYLPWGLVFVRRAWENLGETFNPVEQQGMGWLRHPAGLIVAFYGLFWGNSLEPWHFVLVSVAMIITGGAFILVFAQLVRRSRCRDFRTFLCSSPTEHLRFLWLFFMISFVITFFAIGAFMQIPTLFYAERFSYLLPVFLISVLLIWPRHRRMYIYSIASVLFLFSTFNFITQRECLNWSYVIPWKKIRLEIERDMNTQTVKSGEKAGGILLFDNKSFGALGDYYFSSLNRIDLWDWETNDRSAHADLILCDSEFSSEADAVSGAGIQASDRSAGMLGRRRHPPDLIVLIRSSRDTYPGGFLGRLEDRLARHCRLAEQQGWVEENRNFEWLKRLIAGSDRSIHQYKLWVKTFVSSSGARR